VRSLLVLLLVTLAEEPTTRVAVALLALARPAALAVLFVFVSLSEQAIALALLFGAFAHHPILLIG
jgi:hypothetical protein